MSQESPKNGFDPVSAVMAVATTAIIMIVAWRAFGPTPLPPPPSVGMHIPALRLRDPTTREPQFWMAARGRVTWLSFLTLKHPNGPTDLIELNRIWRKFRTRESFSSLAILCDDGPVPDVPQMPLASATDATRREFLRPETDAAMLHYLIDEEGKIVAIARGTGAALDRLIMLAEERLKFLEPVDRSKFAFRPWSNEPSRGLLVGRRLMASEPYES